MLEHRPRKCCRCSAATAGEARRLLMCTNTGIESYREAHNYSTSRSTEGRKGLSAGIPCGMQLLLSVYVCSSKLYFWQGEAVLSAEIAVKEMMFRQSWDRREEAMIPSRSPNLASCGVDVGRHFSSAILLPPSPKTTRDVSLSLSSTPSAVKALSPLSGSGRVKWEF